MTRSWVAPWVTQADYSHEVAREIDDEVRKLIEAAHTEAWEILTEYRDMLDILAGELLEKETLHRAELEAIFADVEKRPRLTMFDDFGGRIPSDKPPIKTPGELAIERGEPWPPPVPEPAFKAAIARASEAADAARRRPSEANGGNGHGANGSSARRGDPARLRRPGRLARARMAAAATSRSASARQPAGLLVSAGTSTPVRWHPAASAVSAVSAAAGAVPGSRTLWRARRRIRPR